jgi:hypothetical protein
LGIEEVYIRVLEGKLWGNDNLEDLGLDGDNIKMDNKKIGWGVNWIGLGQDIDKWQAVVNALGP